jgi:hypothetical protein
MSHYATLCHMMIRIDPDLEPYIQELMDTDRRSATQVANLLIRSRIKHQPTDPRPITIHNGKKTTVIGHSVEDVEAAARTALSRSSQCKNGHYTIRSDGRCMQKGCKYSV